MKKYNSKYTNKYSNNLPPDLVVVRNGETKFRYPGRVEADGSIRVYAGGGKWMPVTNTTACAARGLDPKTVAAAAKPVECLAHMGENEGGLLVLTVAEWTEWCKQQVAEADAKLDAAVPGASLALRLHAEACNESERYSRAFDRMMEDENNDGARPPRPEDRSIAERLAAHLAQHPRAALYLKAHRQHISSHWSDNTGAGGAGSKAMQILAAGGSIEDATAALAVRREFVD